MATTKKPVSKKAKSTIASIKTFPAYKEPPKSYPEGWRSYLTALELRASRVIAFGIPGTGKTYSANTVGVREGEEVYNIYVGDETAAYQFIGAPSLHNGNTDFEFGPALHAMIKGARLVVNEIDHASADALDALIGVCDDPKSIKVTLPNGSVVRPAEGYHVVATMNGELADLPEALRDRFEGCAIKIEGPHPAAIEALPVELRGTAKKLTAESCPIAQRISIRQFRGFVELIEKGMSEEMAAVCSFQHRAKDLLASMKLAASKASAAAEPAMVKDVLASGVEIVPAEAPKPSLLRGLPYRCTDCGEMTDQWELLHGTYKQHCESCGGGDGTIDPSTIGPR